LFLIFSISRHARNVFIFSTTQITHTMTYNICRQKVIFPHSSFNERNNDKKKHRPSVYVVYSTLCVYNIHNKSYLTLIFVARSRFAWIPLASQPCRPGRLLVFHLQRRVLSVVINWVSLKSISRPLPGRVVSYKIIFKCLRGRVGQKRSNILLV